MIQAIRYSQAFKMEVVREIEKGAKTFNEVRLRYGIKGTYTVQRWVRLYGSGKIGGIIRMEKPEEINESDRLKKENRRLKEALANAHMDLAMEKQCTKMLADLAGVEDLAQFKKKVEQNEPGKQ
jgi:transposase